MTIDTNKTINLKELLDLGFKKTSIMKLVTEADVFSHIERRHGYAINYTYDQTVLICVGCELFNLGLSFRHVDIVLAPLKNSNTRKLFKDLIVIFAYPENLEFEKAVKKEEITHRYDVVYKIIKERKVRTVPLLIKHMSYRDYREFMDVSLKNGSTLGSAIVIDVNEIREVISKLFK